MEQQERGTPILEGRYDLLTAEELCSIVGQDQFCSFNHGENVVGTVAEHRAMLRDKALGLAQVILKKVVKKK